MGRADNIGDRPRTKKEYIEEVMEEYGKKFNCEMTIQNEENINATNFIKEKLETLAEMEEEKPKRHKKAFEPRYEME